MGLSQHSLGAVVFDVTVDVTASATDMCAAVTDLDRMVEIEPRLSAAHWIDGGAPRKGARAEVVGDIPFTVAVVRQVVGHPRGIATLERFSPPHRVAYRLETGRAVGYLAATFDARSMGCVVRVDGWIVPRQWLGRAALAPLRELLRRLADQAVARGVARVGAAVA